MQTWKNIEIQNLNMVEIQNQYPCSPPLYSNLHSKVIPSVKDNTVM